MIADLVPPHLPYATKRVPSTNQFEIRHRRHLPWETGDGVKGVKDILLDSKLGFQPEHVKNALDEMELVRTPANRSSLLASIHCLLVTYWIVCARTERRRHDRLLKVCQDSREAGPEDSCHGSCNYPSASEDAPERHGGGQLPELPTFEALRVVCYPGRP